MVTVAELTVPEDAFPLGVSVSRLTDARVELERVVPTDGERAPHLWVEDADADAVRSALEDAPSAGDATILEDVDHRVLVRAAWNRSATNLLSGIVAADLTVLTATVEDDEWRFVVRADDADAVSTFGSFCREHDIPFEVERVGSLSTVARGSRYDVTEAQHEALLLAYERGYFDSPRRTSLEELAAEVGISRQALANRLRRGHRRLVERTLLRRE
jgi:predicted DNA binding protein